MGDNIFVLIALLAICLFGAVMLNQYWIILLSILSLGAIVAFSLFFWTVITILRPQEKEEKEDEA